MIQQNVKHWFWKIMLSIKQGNDIQNVIYDNRITNSNGNWYSKTNTKIDTHKWTNNDRYNVVTKCTQTGSRIICSTYSFCTKLASRNVKTCA